MANYESALIYTDNERLFEVLERHFEKEENHSLFYEVGEEQIALRNRQGATIDSLLHLSILDADTVITVELSFDSSRHSRNNIYEVKNGNYELIDTEEIKMEYEDFEEDEYEYDDYEVDETEDIQKRLDSPFNLTKEEEEFYEEMNNFFGFTE